MLIAFSRTVGMRAVSSEYVDEVMVGLAVTLVRVQVGGVYVAVAEAETVAVLITLLDADTELSDDFAAEDAVP
jgi:hypothetical protein